MTVIDGREMYTLQCKVSHCFNESLPEWDTLTSDEQDDWEQRAFEQNARDRKPQARLFV